MVTPRDLLLLLLLTMNNQLTASNNEETKAKPGTLLPQEVAPQAMGSAKPGLLEIFFSHKTKHLHFSAV